MRKGVGERPDSPSYSRRSIGSPGIAFMSNAHSIRAIVSQISRYATSIPGQIRRPAPNIQWSRSYGFDRFADSMLFVPSLM